MRLGVPVSLDELELTVARNPVTRRPGQEEEEEEDDELIGAFYVESEDERQRMVNGEFKDSDEDADDDGPFGVLCIFGQEGPLKTRINYLHANDSIKSPN